MIILRWTVRWLLAFGNTFPFQVPCDSEFIPTPTPCSKLLSTTDIPDIHRLVVVLGRDRRPLVHRLSHPDPAGHGS